MSKPSCRFAVPTVWTFSSGLHWITSTYQWSLLVKRWLIPVESIRTGSSANEVPMKCRTLQFWRHAILATSKAFSLWVTLFRRYRYLEQRLTGYLYSSDYTVTLLRRMCLYSVTAWSAHPDSQSKKSKSAVLGHALEVLLHPSLVVTLRALKMNCKSPHYQATSVSLLPLSFHTIAKTPVVGL